MGSAGRAQLSSTFVLLFALVAAPSRAWANADVWELLSGTAPPGARSFACSAYDSVRDRVVVFGGNAGGVPQGDTWEWHYDSAAHQGVWDLVAVANSNDASIPTPRAGCAMAYDYNARRAMLFGGVNNSTMPAVTFGDFFAWDGASRKWTKASGTDPAVGSRAFAGLVVAPNTQILLVGGVDATNKPVPLDTVWLWDRSTLAWTKQAIPGVPPSPRAFAAVAQFRNGLVLQGGLVGIGAVSGETWSLDLYANPGWTRCTVASCNDSGLARFAAAMTEDGNADRVLLYGGFAASGAPLEDTRMWDGTTWSKIGRPFWTPTAPYPGARAAAVLVQEEDIGRTFVYGGTTALGSATADLQDVWDIYRVGQPCSADRECATGHCQDGVCCRTACGGCSRCDLGQPVIFFFSGLRVTDGYCRAAWGRACGTDRGCMGTCGLDGCEYPGGRKCGTCLVCNGATGKCDQPARLALDPACPTLRCSEASTVCRRYRDMAGRCGDTAACATEWRFCTDFTDVSDGTGCNCFDGTCYATCAGGYCDGPSP